MITHPQDGEKAYHPENECVKPSVGKPAAGKTRQKVSILKSEMMTPNSNPERYIM